MNRPPEYLGLPFNDVVESRELPPPSVIEADRLEEIADSIIDAFGDDRSNEQNRKRHDARWEDDQNNQYRLVRQTAKTDHVDYYLDVRYFTDQHPHTRYSYRRGSTAADEYEPIIAKRIKKEDVDRSLVKVAFKELLTSAGLPAPQSAIGEVENASFWDLACTATAQNELIKDAGYRAFDKPVYLSTSEIFDDAREVVESIEPAMPEALVSRVLNIVALDGPRPKELTPRQERYYPIEKYYQ